ncbi:MAG: DUF896 domain-containing protein [Oscillospiraceae bacterium]|nr:DUF896 domain-containing protein [Oscillospiraceae bacterium]
MTQEKINRINELARKSRTAEGLTEAEKAEQARLRQEYRDGIKANLEGQLSNIEFVDKEQKDA